MSDGRATSNRVSGLTTGDCDYQIAHYRHAIAKAKRGQGNANVAVCQDQLDRWLDARLRATPGPRSVPASELV